MTLPNFFILGAPKCGTSSLAVWLSEHENIFMPSVKEPFFFDTDNHVLGRPSPQQYENMFANATDRHAAIGEASTTYLFSKEAVPNILFSIKKSPKFIVCVRNPIEMAVSLHNHLLFEGVEIISDFYTAWSHHGKALTPPVFFSHMTSHPNQLCYGQQCKIGEQIERLFSLISSNAVLFVVLDDIVKNARNEYLKVLEFLDIPDDGRTSFSVYNEGKGMRNANVAAMLSAARQLRKALGVSHAFGIGEFFRRRNTKTPTKRGLSEIVFQELAEYFYEDNKKLGRLIGRDLSSWLSSNN